MTRFESCSWISGIALILQRMILIYYWNHRPQKNPKSIPITIYLSSLLVLRWAAGDPLTAGRKSKSISEISGPNNPKIDTHNGIYLTLFDVTADGWDGGRPPVIFGPEYFKIYLGQFWIRFWSENIVKCWQKVEKTSFWGSVGSAAIDIFCLKIA